MGLDKLKIRPFEYKMHIRNFLDGGKLVDAKVLSISPESIREKFKAKAANLTALSLGSGYITSAAAPHLIAKAFKNLASASLASGFEIKQVADLKAAAAAGPAPKAAAGAPAKEEAAAEPEKEESEGSVGFDMFGGDEY